jgi:hypothetical protein
VQSSASNSDVASLLLLAVLGIYNHCTYAGVDVQMSADLLQFLVI